MKIFKNTLLDKTPNQKGIRCLFAGEILMILSCIGYLGLIPGLEWLAFISFLAIFALVFSLVGIIILKKNNKEFSVAFILILVSIALVVLYIVFSAAINDNWAKITANIIDMVRLIIDVLIIFFVINGVRVLINNDNSKKTLTFGKITVITYASFSICIIVLIILLFIPELNKNQNVKSSFSIASAILSFVTYSLYVFFLGYSMNKVE